MVPDAIAALLSHEASRRMGIVPEHVARTARPIGIEEMILMLYPSSLGRAGRSVALERRWARRVI